MLACSTHDESVMHDVLPVPLLGTVVAGSRLARRSDRIPRVHNSGARRRISRPPVAPSYRTRVRTSPATATVARPPPAAPRAVTRRTFHDRCSALAQVRPVRQDGASDGRGGSRWSGE